MHGHATCKLNKESLQFGYGHHGVVDRLAYWAQNENANANAHANNPTRTPTPTFTWPPYGLPHLARLRRLSFLSVTLLAAVLAIHEAARSLDAFSDMAALRHSKTSTYASIAAHTVVACPSLTLDLIRSHLQSKSSVVRGTREAGPRHSH
jgi:hypothetical protein